MTPALAANVLAYCGQVALVALAAWTAVAVCGIRAPRLLLPYYQGALLVGLIVPLLSTFLTLPVPTEYSVRVVAVAVAGQRLIPFSGRMIALFVALLASLRATTRSRLELAAEILALRHQLAVLQRTTPKRPRLRPLDRLLWVLLSSVWPNWRHAVHIVAPATVVRWHRCAFAACRWRIPIVPQRTERTRIAVIQPGPNL